MMRFILITVFSLMFLGCGKKNTNEINSEFVKEELDTVNSRKIVTDSINDFVNKPSNEETKDWTIINEYFQVYTFSDKVMGLTIELGLNRSTVNALIDSAFNQTALTDSIEYVSSQQVNSCIPIDTDGRLKFYRNLTIEEKLLAGIEKTFFVYCAKGMIQREIKDVVFALDECLSNVVVFRFDKIDFKKYGYPLFGSKTKLDLTFENLRDIDNNIEAFHKSQLYDYSDSIKSISFAHNDSLYFVYDDDFRWSRKGKIKNYFPGRAVYILGEDKKLQRKWALSLDLFGIPCD